MSRFTRILRHRWHDETDVRRVLKPAGIDRIEQRVAASERLHTAEVRVCVEAGLPWSYLWRHASPRERAVAMFGKLRVWDTEHNNGVLIYLLLADRAIEIVADRHIAKALSGPEWDGIVQSMRKPLREGRIEEALTGAIDLLDERLRAHHPLPQGQQRSNLLPNAPDLR